MADEPIPVTTAAPNKKKRRRQKQRQRKRKKKQKAEDGAVDTTTQPKATTVIGRLLQRLHEVHVKDASTRQLVLTALLQQLSNGECSEPCGPALQSVVANEQSDATSVSIALECWTLIQVQENDEMLATLVQVLKQQLQQVSSSTATSQKTLETVRVRLAGVCTVLERLGDGESLLTSCWFVAYQWFLEARKRTTSSASACNETWLAIQAESARCLFTLLHELGHESLPATALSEALPSLLEASKEADSNQISKKAAKKSSSLPKNPLERQQLLVRLHCVGACLALRQSLLFSELSPDGDVELAEAGHLASCHERLTAEFPALVDLLSSVLADSCNTLDGFVQPSKDEQMEDAEEKGTSQPRTPSVESLRPLQLALELSTQLVAVSMPEDEQQEEGCERPLLDPATSQVLVESQLPNHVVTLSRKMTEATKTLLEKYDGSPSDVDQEGDERQSSLLDLVETLVQLQALAGSCLTQCLANLSKEAWHFFHAVAWDLPTKYGPVWEQLHSSLQSYRELLVLLADKETIAAAIQSALEGITSSMVMLLRSPSEESVRIHVDKDVPVLLSFLANGDEKTKTAPLVSTTLQRDTVCLLGLLLSQHPDHSADTNRQACTTMLQLIQQGLAKKRVDDDASIMILLSEVLNALMDIYGDDEVHPHVFNELNVLKQVREFAKELKRRVRVAEEMLTASTVEAEGVPTEMELEEWDETVSNAERFVEYKGG